MRGKRNRGHKAAAAHPHTPASPTAVAATTPDNASTSVAKPPAKVQDTQPLVTPAIIQKFRSKRPAYSNCRMLALDGAELACVDIKKLKWYVAKGLAAWEPGRGLDSDNPAVRLNFEHKQEDQADPAGAFYAASRENRCVGCGTFDHYLKFRRARFILMSCCARRR